MDFLSTIDIFNTAFLTGLIQIVIIDLVLAGDNAVVIAMAARNLPKDKQKLVILFGTLGAIIIRILATLIVVWLLDIPWLLLAGGLLLLFIAYKLLIEEEQHEISAKNSTMAAIMTIIIADATMGLDNVLAIAGAAHGNFMLVIIGLLISVPIIVWGSTLFIKWLNRYPFIMYIGSGILAFTAAKMIMDERAWHDYFVEHPLFKWAVVAFIILTVLVIGRWTKLRRQRNKQQQQTSEESHTLQQ